MRARGALLVFLRPIRSRETTAPVPLGGPMCFKAGVDRRCALGDRRADQNVDRIDPVNQPLVGHSNGRALIQSKPTRVSISKMARGAIGLWGQPKLSRCPLDRWNAEESETRARSIESWAPAD